MMKQPTSEISRMLNVPLTMTNVQQNTGIITENVLGANCLQQPIINGFPVMHIHIGCDTFKITS
jgi:hypothetical protein